VNSLMSKLADAMAGGGQVNVPLEPFLADDALSSAIRANIRHGNRAELKIFLQNAREEIVKTTHPIKPLVRLVGVGCEAMLADELALAFKTLKTMYDACTSTAQLLKTVTDT